MSTGKTWQTNSTSSEQTERLAERLGRNLKGGEVIELVSDLGGGKTTFVRGLARGFGSKDRVGSPSFTIGREYQAGKRTIYHFDFYRLAEAGLVADELAEVTGDPGGVVVVEWGEIVQDVLPEERLTITLISTGDDARKLQFHYPASLAYLLEDVA